MKIAQIKEMMDETVELQIAPLIDCVFQLLIYFMVSASLHKSEGDLGMTLPGTVVQAQSVQMPDEQIIEIDKDGNVALNSMVYDHRDQRDMPELTKTLLRFRAASDAAKTKALVTIQAADETVHQRVIDVMNACAGAGIKNVSFGMGGG